MTKQYAHHYAHHINIGRSEAAWPPQRVAELTRLYVVDGLTDEAIGRRMGMTKNAVVGKRTRLGLVRAAEELRDPSPTLNARLAVLHAELDAILAAPRPRPVAAYKATDNATRPVERRRRRA